jgi:D-sedoheptulose 7-phosphate isomerase
MVSILTEQDIFEECLQRYSCLSVCQLEIKATYDLLCVSFQNRGKLLICGNGGSASDSGHIAGELLKAFRLRRPLRSCERDALGEELASKLQGALPALSLPDFMALNTAWVNDGDPYYHFAQLTWALGNPQDVFWGISTSGNAKNVCLAAQTARAKGMKVVGLSGETGGNLKALCDVCICVPERETYKIQELHLPVYHTLCAMLEWKFFAKI